MLPTHPRAAATFFVVLAATCLAACGGGDDGVAPRDDPEILILLEPVLSDEIARLDAQFSLPSGGPGCLTITPQPVTDGDQDGVPDDATFTFDEEGCSFSFTGGGGTTYGSVHVVDPGAAFGFQATLSDLTASFTSGDPAVTTVRTANGTHTVGGSSTLVTMSREVTIGVTMTGHAASTTAVDLDGTFTPEAGSQVQLGVGTPLPPGQMTLTGTITWSQQATTVQLQVTTPTPLVLDAGCSAGGPVSGEVHLTVLSGADPGYLSVAFTGCGQSPRIDWVAGN